MSIDVLIPTKNRPEKLAMTLACLAHQDTSRAVEVIMRDEGTVGAFESREVRQAWDMLSDRWNTVYIRDTESIGLVRSRECLLKRSMGRSVLWLDDDILLPASALEKLAHELESRRAGFVIPVILDADNARGHDDYSRKPLPEAAHRALGHSRHYVPCEVEYVDQVWRGNGGCIIYDGAFLRKHVRYDFASVTTGEGEDMIASILTADKMPCFLHTGVTVTHLVDSTHQWSWAKVAGSLVSSFVKDYVSQDTLDKSGILSVGYKIVKG
jgi:glycosyltransferase involved in cell wall biosynthesis